MDEWKALPPLGFAVVDETRSGLLAINHVSVHEELGITRSGSWLLSNPDPWDVRDRLTHRILVGTDDGIRLTESTLKESLPSADLSEMVQDCEEAERLLNRTWQAYRDAEPKKRAKLKPLNAPKWPTITKDGDAARILKRVGKRGYPDSAPVEMRDVLALSSLVVYILDAWFELESERLGRAYLRGEEEDRLLYPPNWLARHSAYWPKQVRRVPGLRSN
jgi:hypothetical protein